MRVCQQQRSVSESTEEKLKMGLSLLWTQKKSCAVDCPAVAEDGRPICSSESEARLALSRTRRLASLASLSVVDSVARRSVTLSWPVS